MNTILFVCVHNAGRSQMAKAFFNQRARQLGSDFKAESAGTEPAGQVHPEVVEAMRDLGIDLGANVPKLLTDDMVAQAARVITMGCGVSETTCPAVRFKNVEDWALPDPKGQPAQVVRGIRDQIRARVDELMRELGQPAEPQ